MIPAPKQHTVSQKTTALCRFPKLIGPTYVFKQISTQAWHAEPADVGTYPYGFTVSLLSNAYKKIEERIVKTGNTTGIS